MRRSQGGAPLKLLLILALLLGLTPVALAAPADEVAIAGDISTPVTELVVNYSHDWVSGRAGAHATVDVTLNDSADTLKATASVAADGSGDFFVECDDWASGDCPNIVPGDKAYASTNGGGAEIVPIGEITVTDLDAAGDTLSAELDADWLPALVEVHCQVWEDGGPDIQTEADPNGGGFSCDFGAEGWDLQPGQQVALRYLEPDGDSVIAVAIWPGIRVNVTDNWVGGDYPAGHTMTVTVLDPSGDTKATAEIVTNDQQGWEQREGFETQEGQWSPSQPDIHAFDHVLVEADDGYTGSMIVGGMSADVDSMADSITGRVIAPFDETLDIECQPWGAWEIGQNEVPTKASSAEPDGSTPFYCAWDAGTEWDIEPNQRIGVTYTAPDSPNRVIYAFQQETPHLRIAKRTDSAPAAAGNLHFVVEVWNDGPGDAEDVTLTDTMTGLSYLSDTFGVTPAGSGAGPLVWELGTIRGGSYQQYDLYVEVTAGEAEAVSNTIEIATSNPFDEGELDEKTSTWDGEVVANSTDLNVGIAAWTGDPSPGSDVVLDVSVCNQGDTGSTEVTLTNTMLEGLMLKGWWTDGAGWDKVSSDELVLQVTLPSLDAHTCRSVYVQTHVDDEAWVGSALSAEAGISASNDLSADNNEATWQAEASVPRLNVWVDKDWGGGQLVAGGEIHYWISYVNDGNVPALGLEIVDTLPEGTTFLSSWRHDDQGDYEVEPASVSGNQVTWRVYRIDNGYSSAIEVVLRIDDDTPVGSVLTNRAEITELTGEQWLDDNSDEWTEQVYEQGPNLRVSKTAEWRDDGVLEYHIHFENVGTETVEDVSVTDQLPADTTWEGWWNLEFDNSRLQDWDYLATDNLITWQFDMLYPGDNGWLRLAVVPDQLGVPLLTFTNTVEITTPVGDVNPADNSFELQSSSGGEVRRVEFWINPEGSCQMWGEAVPDTAVTVVTPSDSYPAYADPACNGCWSIGDVGSLKPGDAIEIKAGAELQPLNVTVPDPFDAAADTAVDEVQGQVGGLDAQWVQVYGDWDDGYRVVQTDSNGVFAASYDDIPRGASGYIRHEGTVDYTTVIWHRPFDCLDLMMTVNYGQNWVQAQYEAGHLGWFDVTEGDGSTYKATSEVESQVIPDWVDWTGFATSVGDPWQPERPDIMPGDWVYGLVDNGNSAEVRVGTITGTLDLDADTVEGTIDVPWSEEDLLVGWCSVWEDGGPTTEFEFDPQGGGYLCDLNAAGWDLDVGHHVAVGYNEPDGDTVLTVLFEPVYKVMMPVVTKP